MSTTEQGFIGRLVRRSAENPLLAVAFAAVLAGWGWLALARTPLDAIPDLSDTQAIILTEWPGRSPDLVEDQVTYPISSTLLAAPKVEFVRGQSFFGLSFVYVIFEEGTDIYWARSRVLETMAETASRLPEGARTELGPDATGVGWVFQYALVDRSGGTSLEELRSLQDWQLRYALESVPGVAEVASLGGFEREYQVQIDPLRLRAFGVGLEQVTRALREANMDSGGRTIELAGHENMIRGRGYLRSLDDLRTVPVGVGENSVPVLVRDLGEVAVVASPRRGIAELDGDGEAVGGIVIMRYGENALRVIDAVKQRMEELRAGLPAGVDLVVTYDRSELIRASIDTLRTTLIEEMTVVSLVIFLFLLHPPSALVVLFTLPIAVLAAFIPMERQGLTANIMSLGGIAVAIGAMVDASIILIENAHKHLEAWEEAGRPGPRREAIVEAMQEVAPSIFFSLLVITVSFLPVFALQASEGRLFRPLAFTKTYSMGFAAVLAVTLTPALAVLFIRGTLRSESRNPLNRWLAAAYAPVVRVVVNYRHAVVAVALAVVVLTLPAWMRLGNEFMPPLHEGVILYMPTAPPGMSATQASTILQSMDRRLAAFHEVETVFGKMGRADTATDPAPIGMVETTIVLRPRDQWRPGVTWESLIAEMDAALRIPGMPNVWWMPVQTRTEMLATGVRSPLGIQVFGDNLEEIESTATAIEAALGDVPGTRSVFAERAGGGFFVDLSLRRADAARYGISVADLDRVIATAIGGLPVSEWIDGRRRYPLTVRYGREYRDTPEALGQVLIRTSSGAQIPIAEVADLAFTTGPDMVRSEDGKLVGFVFVDTERAIADYVADARRRVDERVAIPAGVRIAWVGQFKYYERARETLAVLLPITLAIVVGLLWWNTRSLVETCIVLTALPFSLVGAVWLLWFLDYNVSVAVWVGIIALAGLDAETGVVMLLYLSLAWKRATKDRPLADLAALRACIVDGAARRLRPKLMTVATTMIGLLPILWSDGTGADVMKRIAAPMVGGLATSFLLELTVYPALFAIWKERELAPPASAGP